MTSPLVDWPRPHFAKGGKNPFVFYVVYGWVDIDRPFSRSAYRSRGLPDGIDLTGYGPTIQPMVVSQFRTGYGWGRLVAQDPDLAAVVAAQDFCLVIRGDVTDPPSLSYFRDLIGLLTFCLDAGGVAIYDPQILKWWSPADWRARAFGVGHCEPRQHVVTFVSPEKDGTAWFHTRGMRKFGRPDVSIHNVRPEHRAAIIDLVNRFIDLLAFGGRVPDGQPIRMSTLPQGMTCWHRGSEDDPDFNNEHLEILWPEAKGG
ncbi:hypothetical protein [Bradyrhizobium sp. STM 3809]|uniref:hypothetical protein n=1 Tax=Bradyrhizobium sp. STM 3809 TaxID=551936 RepID=UPI00024081A8|nr:hypothetical protein [Bradyrhizobium sp. STM 3809]CCE02932.1 conserved hypothetical protein [Bradyrhizobium sp. STM 3809]